MADEQRQRAAHEQRDGRQQDDRRRSPRDRGRRRQSVPARRFARVTGQEDGQPAQVGQNRGNAEPHRADGQLEGAVRAKQQIRAGGSGAGVNRRRPEIGPPAGEIATGTQPHHEHGDDQRRGVHRVAEHVAEHADPDDLVDQAAETGEEKEEVDQEGR